MADSSRFDPFVALGTLRAGLGATQRELVDALRDVQAAVDGGQTAPSLLGAAHRDLVLAQATVGRVSRLADAAIEQAALLPLSASRMPLVSPLEPDAATHTLVSIRTAPLADADPLAPQWTRAMRPSASRGPFVNDVGERFWIDTFQLPRLVNVVAQASPFSASRMLARLPLSRRLTPTARRRIGAGSVWLPANVFDSGRPVNEFVGVRISGGSVLLDGITAATSSTITLSGAWRLVLTLQLDPPDNPAPVAGPGADSANAIVTLPATVTLTLDASGATTVEVADSSATAYDTSVGLVRSLDPPFYDEMSGSIVVPCTASSQRFDFATVRSAAWKINGSAAITRSGWALGIAVTTAQALGEASGAGSLWFDLRGVLRTQWTGLPRPALLPKSVLALAPGAISFWATVSPADVTHRLQLWEEPASDPLRHSSVEVTSVAGSTVFHLSQPGSELVLFTGKAIGHLDRPLAADGGRVAVRMPAAWFVLVDLPGGTSGGVLAADPTASASPHLAFALENALLKARPPAWLGVSGPLSGDQLDSGLLLLRFPFRTLLPTLPDPYAANFGFDRQRDTDGGWATAAVAWTAPAAAMLGFTVQSDQASTLLAGQSNAAAGVGTRIRDEQLSGRRVLLDVSSNADQFGVAIPYQAPSVRVQGLAVVAQAREVEVLTLPPISWEPMLARTPEPGSGDVPLPPPPHDGGVALLTADTAAVQPLEPIALLATYHDAINQRRHFAARLPLPFGLVAQIQTQREQDAGEESQFIPNGGQVFFNRPGFDGSLAGGLQLAIRGRPNGIPDSRDPTLPGYVELRNENDYAKGVLSQNIHTRFNGDFGVVAPGPSVPLRHYELSGYGASLFSDWRDPEAVGPAIIEARFDVMVGRTAHEVIQMQSMLHPWFIRVVRTITIDRTRGGWMLREDSGWVPTSDGRFAYRGDPNGIPPLAEAFPEVLRHPGAIEAVVNVRHIRLDGAQFPVPARQGTAEAPTVWQPVRFDADVLFTSRGSPDPRLVVSTGSSGGRTPSRNLSGWILIDGPAYQTKALDGQIVSRARPAGAHEVFDLLQLSGPAMGPVDCTLLLGGNASEPGLVFRAVRVDVSCNQDRDTPHLVAAVRGSPALPRDGAWSLARLSKTDSAPNALAPSFPVPLVGPNSAQAGFGRWHLADPADITQLGDTADPTTRYSFVQSLGTQKVLFARPRVGSDPDPITLPQPPKLADMGALLSAAGIFPGLGDAFDFQSLKALSVTGGDLGFSESFPIGSKGALKEAVLMDLGPAAALQVVIEYHDEHDEPTLASIRVDPTASPRWELSLARACFAVRFKGNRLISIFATVRADERSAPTVADIHVRYESILNTLQSIFTNVQQVARFLPGGAAAGLKVSFSQGHLTVRNAFALPNLPLGPGQITDIAVEMGFDVVLSPMDVRFVAGLGSSQKPFRWIVSPLAGTGVVQVGIGKGGLDVLVQGGLGLGLAIDLGIASGAASIALALELNTGPDPFELKAILSGRASVDVLAGLASATITLAAGLGIIPPPELFKPPFLPPQLVPPPSEIPELTVGLEASISVGIHLSICWVVDVDFDGYWQFRQDITAPAIPIPL